jgi:hypothetical protein
VSLKNMSSAARGRRLALGAVACAGAVGAASIGVAASPARAAHDRQPAAAAAAPKPEQLNQTMVLNVSNIQGNTITANGQEVTGQISGVMSFSLTLRNGSQALSHFSIYNNGHMGKGHRKGTVQGNSTGNYHVSGAQSYFTGRILSVRGTEELAGARNFGITVSGTLNRRTYKLTVNLKGKYVE